MYKVFGKFGVTLQPFFEYSPDTQSLNFKTKSFVFDINATPKTSQTLHNSPVSQSLNKYVIVDFVGTKVFKKNKYYVDCMAFLKILWG